MENLLASPHLHVEVVATTLRSCIAAEMAGANRIELCSALSTAGLTPSAGLIQSVKRTIQIPVFVFIRPREGSFVYDQSEEQVILRDIEASLLLGADGIVFGALTSEGKVNVKLMKKVMTLCVDTPVTFHRAFDLCENKEEALEELISLGIKRVLTSGGFSTCIAGKEVIHGLANQANGRIAIMPGGGLTAENISEIYRSDIRDYHLSGRDAVKNNGIPSTLFDLDWQETNLNKVRHLVSNLHQLALVSK